MAEASFPHNNEQTSEPEWRRFARLFSASGVVEGIASELEATADGASGTTVEVAAGDGYVNGFLLHATGVTVVAFDAADPVDDRIDVLVMRYDPDGSAAGVGSVRLGVVTGIPDSAPVVPALTQDPEGVWEEALYDVTVQGGAANIGPGDLADRRVLIEPGGSGASGLTVETEAGSTYTVVAGDNEKVKRFTANATVSLPDGLAVGTVVELLAYHADGITVEAGGTATVRNEGDVEQYQSVSCLVTVADEWVVTGAVS